MTQRITEGLRLRILLTVYYGLVWGFEVHRYVSTGVRREVLGDMDFLHVAMFASLVLISWWLCISLRATSDRIAALLYGLFYAIRIGSQFVKRIEAPMLMVTECAIISAGMIAMIIGLIHTILHDSDHTATTTP